MAIAAYDRPPEPAALEELKKLKARGCYLIGFGPRDVAEIAPHAALCDAWFESGGRERFTRDDTLANAVNGWALVAEVVGSLTRLGKMPLMWKSFSVSGSLYIAQTPDE